MPGVTDWRVPLSDVIMTDEDIAAVVDVLRSGWLSLGPRTRELEEHLAAYTGAGEAVAVANGTAALHLACLAAGLGPGDEVVVPSMTFVATVNAIAYTGARPVFADIVSPLEPWLSSESVEAAITDRTRAVMNMSYGGHAGELVALEELCRRHGLMLLEDSAHALGTRLAGRSAGTFGKAGIFSFFSNKNLAVGEGGAVVTDDPEFAIRLRLLRSHGMTSLSWDRHRGHASGYDVVALGFNYRIDEPRAALAMARLARLDRENAQRAQLAATYRSRLDPLGIELPLGPVEGLEPAHHIFCMLLPAEIDRDRFRQELTAQRIQTSMHYPPVHDFSIYRDARAELPVTETYAARTVTLPMFAHMTEDQQNAVIEAVSTALSAVAA